jgi:hypothetical protein
MKRFFYYIAILTLSAGLFGSCVKDLNTLPLDENLLLGEDVYSSADGYTGVLAKCYVSFIVPGQGNDNDISNMDAGYSCFTRALFYLQECTTDEVIFHAGSAKGSMTFITMDWDPSTEINSYI